MGPLTWEFCVEGYLDEMRSRKSFRTLRAFQTEVRKFRATLNLQTPTEVGPEHVTAYLEYLLGTTRKVATAWGYLARLLPFFRWLARRKVVLWNPAHGLKFPNFSRSMKRPLSPREVRQLLDSPNPDSWAGARDRALLEFLYGTGLRRGEVQALDVGDVLCEDGLVQVRHGKTGARWAVMGPRLAERMRDYLQRVRPEVIEDSTEAALFVTRAGRRLTYAGLGCRLKKLSKRAGLKFTPHALRHAFATHLVQNGASLRWVQALLGHRSLLATQVYTQLAATDVLREFRRTHPRARRKKSREELDRKAPGLAKQPGPQKGHPGGRLPLPDGL